MEGKIIQALQFNFTMTSSLRFLERYAQLIKMDDKNLMLAKYILEFALLEYKLLIYTPSNLACSAIYLVNKIKKLTAWPDVLLDNT